MYYQRTFAQVNNLRPGDVVIAPKSIFNVVDHYVVYLGLNHFGREVYIENDFRNGVQLITGEIFAAKNAKASGIRKFNGNDTQRYWACERAKSLLTAKYDLKTFNCENFANFVQYGVSYSNQIKVAETLLVAGTVVSLISILGRYSK